MRSSMKFLFVIAMMCSFAHADSMDGIWRSQGYGYAFDIQGSKLKAFEVTTTTCVQGFTAERATPAPPGREATFNTSGYLRILSFSGFSKEGGFQKGLQSLESALDEIFSDAAIKAVVIDVRINFGGADPYGLAIASRLATNEYLAYTKEARSDPNERDKWTPGDPSVVKREMWR